MADVLSALVILQPSDPSAAGEPITSANLGRHTPSPGAVGELMEFFRSRGFEVGPFVGISFSITAPESTFRSVFDADLPTGARGDLEFDVGSLPADVRRHLQAVSFSEPPDFGPGAP